MVKTYNEYLGKWEIDNRHVVKIINSISHATAIIITNDGTYESITYMDDDYRSWENEAIIDATEEELESYRKYCRKFKKGDKVVIARGRKMKGEIKEVESLFTFKIQQCYGHADVDYLVFTDGSKVNKLHCDFI